jgi:L-fuculose-phosphate aldolase
VRSREAIARHLRHRQLDRAILATARALRERSLVVGSVGNVSSRRPPHIRITPSRVPYDRMKPSDLVTVDQQGRAIGATRTPSLELKMHLQIYGARPDVGAVVHCHSPHATAWSFLGEPLPALLEEQAYYGIGTIEVGTPGPAGSAELARAVVAALGDSSTALVGRHGVVAVGKDCAAAMVHAELVEHVARVAWLLRIGRDRSESQRVALALDARH